MRSKQKLAKSDIHNIQPIDVDFKKKKKSKNKAKVEKNKIYYLDIENVGFAGLELLWAECIAGDIIRICTAEGSYWSREEKVEEVNVFLQTFRGKDRIQVTWDNCMQSFSDSADSMLLIQLGYDIATFEDTYFYAIVSNDKLLVKRFSLAANMFLPLKVDIEYKETVYSGYRSKVKY